MIAEGKSKKREFLTAHCQLHIEGLRHNIAGYVADAFKQESVESAIAEAIDEAFTNQSIHAIIKDEIERAIKQLVSFTISDVIRENENLKIKIRKDAMETMDAILRIREIKQ